MDWSRDPEAGLPTTSQTHAKLGRGAPQGRPRTGELLAARQVSGPGPRTTCHVAGSLPVALTLQATAWALPWAQGTVVSGPAWGRHTGHGFLPAPAHLSEHPVWASGVLHK